MKLFLLAINSLALLTTIATLIGFASPYFGLLTFLEHPRPQYALLLLIASCLNLSQPHHSPKLAWLWLIPLVINLALLLPYLLPIASPPQTAAALRILHTTLDHSNPKSATKTLGWLDRQDLDLIFILEIPPGTIDQFKTLTHYQLVTANLTSPNPNYSLPTNHAQALLLAKRSNPNLSLIGTRILNLPADNRRPLLAADIRFQNKPLTIVDFHSIRPRHAKSIAYQTIEFDAMAQWSRSQLDAGQSVLLIGDWNTTPWSLSYRRFLGNSGLVDSMVGRGIQNSWNADWPGFLRIPIDHAWHSDSIEIRDRQLGPHLGSDHFPLRIDLQWKP
jgi:endonuclease/exonuclease/phosphatase (EEP) superfamily protein YafD